MTNTPPSRIFLDTSVLQTIQDYGPFVFEGEPIPPGDRIHKIPEGREQLEALQHLFQIVDRGPFEFALSEGSLKEVDAKRDSGFLRWAHDVLDHWSVCTEENGLPEVPQEILIACDSPTLNFISAADRILIRDAVTLGCDSLLTMEGRLPKNAPHIQKILGLRVDRPSWLWDQWKPFAGLYG